MVGEDNKEYIPVDFAKIKIASKSIDDITYNISTFRRADDRFGNKDVILQAIRDNNYGLMREISDFYYRTSGIYNRLCRYMAYMYRYDWMVTPYINSDSVRKERVLKDFNKVLKLLDDFGVKKFLGETALKVIRKGCYYGYIIHTDTSVIVQELPPRYCRSRFTAADGTPLIEFNLRFFDEMFRDTTQKMKMLEAFPKEFKKAYIMYKEGRLPPEFAGDVSGWYLLEPGSAIKFNINGEDFPAFVSVIPAIIDLDEAQGLDKQKMK